MLVFFSFIRGQFLQGLISLIELPEDTNVPDDEHFIEIEDTPGERCRETDTWKFVVFIRKSLGNFKMSMNKFLCNETCLEKPPNHFCMLYNFPLFVSHIAGVMVSMAVSSEVGRSWVQPQFRSNERL